MNPPRIALPDPWYMGDSIRNRWDRYSDKHRQIFIDFNTKEAKRRAARYAAIQAGAPPRFDAAKEKRRAKAAYRLKKWRRSDDSRISMDEAGIIVHREEVAEYERTFGDVSKSSRASYGAIYAGIRSGAEHQRMRDAENQAARRRAAAWREATRKRQEAAAAQARAERAERARARSAGQRQRDIEHARRVRPWYEQRVASAMWNRDQNQERAEKWAINLATPAYQNSRGFHSYQKAMKRCEELAAYWATRVTYYQGKLDALPEID